MAWTDEDVERWLTDYPLPRDFEWNGEIAWPRYNLKKGYGQWVRTAGSYHPALRGLWRACCTILIDWAEGRDLPSPDILAAELRATNSMGGTLGFDPERDNSPALPDPDDPANQTGQGVDFAAKLRAQNTPAPR